MTRNARNHRLIALALTSALATTALTGCTTAAAPRADVSASKAQVALQKGKTSQAVENAEAAVLAQPHDPQYRTMLATAYMEAGRFQSAATTFQDAMTLGDNSPRTALSYALAETALGHYTKAQNILDDWRDDIDPADLGLAFALAGNPGRGVSILANQVRGGNNTAKVRQNLAYSYAMQGDWRSARIMAAEDVPPDQLDKRLGEWSVAARPESYQARVAALLDVPLTSDTGQPAQLALVNNPSTEQLASEAAAMVPEQAKPTDSTYAYAAPSGELAPLDAAAPAPQVATAAPAPSKAERFETAFASMPPSGATPAQMTESAMRFVSKPVVQTLPARYGASAGASRSTDARVAQSATPEVTKVDAPAGGSHLVQLGSFSSREGARRAWGVYAKRYPKLSQYQMVITEARVRGKTYFRVSAGGFARAEATSMCSTVKAGGHGCYAWADGHPMPGAVDTGLRMASR